MKIAFVRGGYLNNFEAQNFAKLGKGIDLEGFSSLRSLHSSFPFKVTKLPSLYDFGIPTWVANRTWGDRQILFGLESRMRNFDLVHTADPHYYYSYQLAKLRKNKQIKFLISTSWETIPCNNESTKAKRDIKRFCLTYIDHFLCYTERAKKCLITEGISPKKITVIHIGVDLKRFFPGKKIKHNAKVRILFTGRDVPEKGLNDLRIAVSNIKKKHNAELLVANNVPYDKMPEAYRLADIFAMPSKTTPTWEEQYGMSLVEAMATGLPIVAYKSGSIPELLENVGILVKEGDGVALTKQLTKLVTNHTLRLKLGTMARRKAEHQFDSAKVSKKLQSFYETQYRNSHT